MTSAILGGGSPAGGGVRSRLQAGTGGTRGGNGGQVGVDMGKRSVVTARYLLVSDFRCKQSGFLLHNPLYPVCKA